MNHFEYNKNDMYVGAFVSTIPCANYHICKSIYDMHYLTNLKVKQGCGKIIRRHNYKRWS